ncbi:phosphatidate cytidylyltransferase [Neobacillus notoginsengisoli]|uniref:Phosphatidate cytidylyltransferase n=1 Tax=Neobacillus notoginsengisoli TaxID=1578198 RepID=A0A417YQ85_9BACI|nr:phosphatidate cytidylyltransferase [Neobacillus notoginsengisoli]RHW36409.1 phosphatidate cytidylyltransferase [Neobacillus notoginsengisoli]
MKQRIITAVVAAALFLPIVIIGGRPLILLAYLLASAGFYELVKMKKLNLASFPGIVSLVTLWLLILPPDYTEWIGRFGYGKQDIAVIAVLLLLAYTVASKNRFTFDDASFLAMAVAYVGAGFYFFMETRNAGGLSWLFYSLFIMWATDSGAYFVGRAKGKRKLWPEISPNKTVEGFLGGIMCALLVAIGFVVFSDLGVPAVKLLIVTAFLSVFGQLGDLAESAFKRNYHIKDSGNILPGHGGILDRFDSLLFVWPLIHIFQLI